MDIMWRYMDIMKLMTAMPIEIKQDLVAGSVWHRDYWTIVILSVVYNIEEVTRNFRFMHFAMYIYDVAW